MTSKSSHYRQHVASTEGRVFVRRQMKRVRLKAFSLVEVALAVGIMGFAFVSILGLMPVGLTNFRETKNTSVASQIAQQIFAEVESSSFSELTGDLVPGQSLSRRLPPPGPDNATVPLRCFDEQGQELSATDAKAVASAIYRVNVRVVYSIPPVQNSAAAAPPALNPALANVTIQIAYNPGNLPMDPAANDQYFWTGKSRGMTVPTFTYQTLVARKL